MRFAKDIEDNMTNPFQLDNNPSNHRHLSME